jgi:hypothetical protein
MNKKRISDLCRLVRKGRVIFFLLAAAIVFAGPSNALNRAGEYLPANISGMEQKKVISGEEAATIINRMHRGDVATHADYIAEYRGAAGSATYYLSLYENPEQAAKAMKDMARVMEEEGHGFSHLMQRVHNGQVFYMGLALGQAHYFFARGVELVWLAVDVAIAEQAVMEVLNGS